MNRAYYSNSISQFLDESTQSIYGKLAIASEFTVEQGHMVGRPGQGTVEILQTADQIVSVKVGGSAVRTLDGYIYITY